MNIMYFLENEIEGIVIMVEISKKDEQGTIIP